MKTTHWKQLCAVLLNLAFMTTALRTATLTVTNANASGPGLLRQATCL